MWFKKCCEKHVFIVFIKQKNVFGTMFQITYFSVRKIIVYLVCVYLFFKK